MNSLHELLEAYYGLTSAPHINRETDTVSDSATKIVNNNPKRIALTIINLSANDMYIMIDENVSSTRGIYVSPNGGSVTLRWTEDFDLVAYNWYAIADIAASEVLVIEEVIV